MRTLRRLLILLLLIQWTLPVRAAFDDTPVGGRAPGLAGAYSAVADNADAPSYNPAGLVQLDDSEISTHYGQLTGGVTDGSTNSDTYFSYAHPLHDRAGGVLSLGYRMFKASNLLSERTLMVGYGRLLPYQPFDWNALWSFGVNLKQLYREFQPDRFTENALNDAGTGTSQGDPLFAQNGYNSTAYALDLGTLARFGPGNRHSASLTFTNANRPDVSLGGDGDKPPFVTKLGFATRPHWGLMSFEIRRAQRLASQTDTDLALGAERQFHLSQSNSMFVVRGGYAQGSRDYKDLTLGVSYLFPRLSLDYAFDIPVGNLTGTSGTHRLGLTFKLGTAAAAGKKSETEEKSTKADATTALPNAPQTLVAPVAVEGAPKKQISEVDATATNYGVLLGHYFTRKEQGASLEERKVLLLEMKDLYKDKGMDLSIVNRELDTIAAAETPKPEATPTASPTPEATAKPSPTPVPVAKAATVVTPKAKVESATAAKSAPVKIAAAPHMPVKAGKPVRNISAAKISTLGSTAQMVAASTELSEAMRYYHQAVERGLSDRERIEVLETILLRFGESGAVQVTPELERLHKRIKK